MINAWNNFVNRYARPMPEPWRSLGMIVVLTGYALLIFAIGYAVTHRGWE